MTGMVSKQGRTSHARMQAEPVILRLLSVLEAETVPRIAVNDLETPS